MNTVKLIIKDLQKKIRLNPGSVSRVLRKALAAEKLLGPGEVTVCFVDAPLIRRLNRQFLGERTATDVIAFTLQETGPGGLIADIAVCTDTAVRQAKQFKTDPLFETYLYAVHGVLHVAGHTDDTDERREAMNARAAALLEEAAACRSTKRKR